MNKKGAELSMNVIIIAAIGLLVLVILAILVINSAGKTNTGIDCISKGGICKTDCGTMGANPNGGTCSTSGQTCCAVVSTG